MAQELAARRVAALVTHGFEQSELLEPKRALEQAGATVDIIAPAGGAVRGWKNHEWGDSVPVTQTLDDAEVTDYDAMLLPGGVMNADALRMDPRAVAFVREMFDDGKPMAVICHGPWTLINAGVTYGLRLTSWPSLKRTCPTPAPTGSMPRSWWTAASSRHASPPICLPLTGR